MLATCRAALDEAQRVDGAPADRIAAALSFGALMGARGNSGVITSQVFGGMSEALSGKRRFNGVDLAFAFGEGTDAAYRAVSRPVEGTILTVVREASEAARAAAEETPSVEAVLAAAVEAARAAVERTPTLLPILRDAGVVDAGGQGFLRLLEGALGWVREPGVRAVGRATATATPEPVVVEPRADDGFGYETMFLLQAPSAGHLDLESIREHLAAIGDSVLVAGDAHAAKVHVHSARPDQVIAYGLSLGALTRITVENLDSQAREVREARAAEFTGVATAAPASGPFVAEDEDTFGAALALRAFGEEPREARNGHGTSAQVAPEPPGEVAAPGPAVVAVASGEGMARILEEFGADQVIRGGQSENPSTGELLRVARLARSRDVLILPNNPNARLAAEQAAALCRDRRIVVVPTRNAAEGLAALLALDPTRDAAANAGPMTDAARGLATLAVTEAIRDATISGRRVRKGQTLVLDPDEGLVAVDGDTDRAVLAGVATLPPGAELITLYYGDGAQLGEAEALGRRIGAARPGAEIELIHGGQLHYRYLISAE